LTEKDARELVEGIIKQCLLLSPEPQTDCNEILNLFREFLPEEDRPVFDLAASKFRQLPETRASVSFATPPGIYI
jgi:hypothetical protein